jgi:type II secretory pathway pseudopilin PulG
VILIISFLALLIVPRVVVSTLEAKERTCFHNRAQINSAAERYFAVNDAFPTDISQLNTDEYFPSGIPVCPVSGAAYALDPTTHRVDGHTTGNH